MIARPAAPRGASSRLLSLSALLGGSSTRARAAAPARDRPLSSSPVPKEPFPPSSPSSPCNRDLCVAAAAAASSSSSSSSKTSPSPLSTSDWWRDDEDLWEEPRTKEEFERALACGSEEDGGSKPELVLVAFYASWCKGCRRLHPELTALAEEAAGQGGGGGSSSPLAGGKVKFVRVNYDRLRAVAAGAGATVLPFVAAFAPRGGNASGPPLLGWQAVASKPGATRANLIAMLSSGSALPPRGKKWAFPKASSSAGGIGGSAAPLLPELVDAAEAEAADRAREVEKLAAQASTAGLFERLAAMAGSGSPGGGSGARGARPPAALSVPPSSVPPPPAPSPRNQLARANPEQKRAFLSAYPGDYNPFAEPVAAAEVAPRLRGLVYLDSTGAALYSNTQVDQLAADLRENAFGNPHTGTASPPAALSSARIEEAREMVLEWFNADPGEFFFFPLPFFEFQSSMPPRRCCFFSSSHFLSLSLSLFFSHPRFSFLTGEYACVFLPSATAALKTVGEAFAWSSGSGSGSNGSGNGSGGGSEFRYLRENHNSVLGIRGYAEAKGARAVMMTEDEVESWLEESSDGESDGEEALSLFAFPALDNFSGVLHPPGLWAQRLREKNGKGKKWFTLLDAAAFAPAHSLDLSLHSPDFVSLSFYKMFGLPTGVGALLVRREAFSALSRVYFGGGSTAIATAAPGFNVLKCEPVASFEDGTLPFLDIAALRHGFDFLRRLGAAPAGKRAASSSDGGEIIGSEQLARHTAALAHFAASELQKIKHRAGAPAVFVFGKHASPHWKELQGGIVNFEIVDRDSGGKLEVAVRG